MSSYYVFHEDKIEQAIEEWVAHEMRGGHGLAHWLHEDIPPAMLVDRLGDAVRMFLRSETLKRLEMRKD